MFTNSDRKRARRQSINDREFLIAVIDEDYDGANRLISEGVNVNYKDRDDCTALHLAATNDSSNICRLLVDNGALLDVKNINGETPLDIAKRFNKSKIIQIFEDTSYDFLQLECSHNPVHGNMYQLKIIMLVLYRAVVHKYSFRLGTEVEEARKFNDLLFEYKDKGKKMYRLLQAKHKISESKKITSESLMADTRGDYSLIKYLMSYHASKKDIFFKNGTIQDVTICTNIDFDYKNLQKAEIEIEKVSVEDDIFDMKSENKESARYKFTKGLVNKLKIKLQNSKLGLQCNISEDEIEDFLKHLVFAVNQPNEMELANVIKKELRREFDKSAADNVYNKFSVCMLDWMTNKDRDVFWSYEDGKKIFDEMKKGMSVWYNVQDPVKSFTGKEIDLKNLHSLMQTKKIVCVSGLGGVGKSELVRKYIAEYCQSYNNTIVWINAKSYQTLCDSFRKLACEKIDIKTKNANGREKDITALVSEIYQYFSNEKSLFVFDDSQMYETQSTLDAGIDKFLPNDSQKPYVLITSRNQKWPKDFDVQVLEGFTSQEAELFITQNLKSDRKELKEHAAELAKKLQFLPLALQQAVYYINTQNEKLKNIGSSFEISDYFEKMTQGEREIFDFTFSKDSDNTYTKTVYTTWNVTLDTIKEKENGKEPLDILNISSYFLPDNIPIDMLSIVNNDKETLSSAIELLKQHSLINVQRKNFNVHGLVQIIMRLKLNENSKEKVILKMILSNIETAHVNVKNTRIDHFVSIWSHCAKYVDLVKEFHEVATVICEMLMSSYRFDEARLIITKAMKILPELPEPNFKDSRVDLLSFRSNYAALLFHEGKYKMALEKFLEIHKIEKRVCGLRNRNSLKTMASISFAYLKLEKISDALKWCEETLRTEKLVFGENHLNTLSTKTLLANILIHEREYEKALSLLEQIYEAYKMTLNDNDSAIIKVKSAIALIYRKQIKYDEALKILKVNYNLKRRMLGENHRDTLADRILIADVNAQQYDKYALALKIYEEVLEFKLKTIGENHPEVIELQLSIVDVLKCFDPNDKSLLILQDVLRKQRINLGSYHLSVFITEWMMTMILDKQGKSIEALKMIDDLFKFRLIINSSGITSTYLHVFAFETLKTLKNYDKALKHTLKIFRIHKKNLGNNHLVTLRWKEEVGMIYYHKKDYKKTLDILTEVNKTQERVLGEDDANYKRLLDTIQMIITEISLKAAKTSFDTIQFINNSCSAMKDPFAAIHNDDLPALKKLFDDGTDPNSQSEDGRTLLHCAVSENNLEIVEFLIKNGADVTRVSNKGNTIFHIAALNNYNIMTVALFGLAKHIDLNRIINAKTKLTGKTALHVASENGFDLMTRILLIHGAAYDIKNESNKTPKDVARDMIISELLEKVDDNFQLAKIGKEQNYKLFEQYEPKDFLMFCRAQNSDGYNLLQLGVMNNNKTLVHEIERIIEGILRFSQPNFDRDFNVDELLPLTLFPTVQRLRGYSCNTDPFHAMHLVKNFRIHGKSMLDHNILAMEDMLELLESPKKSKTLTELAHFVIDNHYKLFVGSLYSVELLKASAFNDIPRVMHCLGMQPYVNVEDKDGETPLLYAVNYGNEKMIKLLFLHGANAKCQTKTGKQTPLLTAVFNGDMKIVEILLERDRRREFVNAKNVIGYTAMHMAAEIQRMDIVMLLLKNGAAYCLKNDKGLMPVDLIDDCSDKKIFELMDDLFDDVAKGSTKVIRKIEALKPPEFFAVVSACNDEEYTLSDFALVKHHKDLSEKIKNVIEQFRKVVESA